MNYTVSQESFFALCKDIKEARKCFEVEAYKAAMLLCGSILEHALLDRLSIDPSSANQAFRRAFASQRIPSSLEDWNLSQLLQVSHSLSFISRETHRLCELLRDYRNLIHPAVASRTAINPNRVRAQRSLEAVDQALTDLDRGFVSTWQEVDIIDVSSVQSAFISDKVALHNSVENMANQRNLAVNDISSFARLQALLRNPQRNLIVVNTHGEIMPVPPRENWRDFYVQLGRATSTFGWIFVTVGGYPFYYRRPNQPVGDAGLNAFLSVAGMSANCMNPRQAMFTEVGLRVLRRAGMRGLPQQLFAFRCTDWEGVTQKIVFLKSDSSCGASAVRIGRGWYINLGLDSNLGSPNRPQQELSQVDTILGNLAMACALYVAGLI